MTRGLSNLGNRRDATSLSYRPLLAQKPQAQEAAGVSTRSAPGPKTPHSRFGDTLDGRSNADYAVGHHRESQGGQAGCIAQPDKALDTGVLSTARSGSHISTAGCGCDCSTSSGAGQLPGDSAAAHELLGPGGAEVKRTFWQVIQLPLVWILLVPIQAYRKVISPFFPPRCRFYPSCSAYGVASIRKYGPFVGLYRTLMRLLRCHPWHAGGYDPP
jgi:uncharacterized protein